MKRIGTLLFVTVAVLSATGVAEAAEKYNVDSGHSYVGFTVKHLGVASVRGEFKEYSTELIVDEENVLNSSLVLEIDAASVDTDEDRRDEHLRSADFFEVETYPEIVFKSKRIEEGDLGRYKATGDLTIHGVTKEVVLDLEINGPITDPWGNHRVGAEGEVTINRQDYDVKFSRVMDNGGLIVADNVLISFALEASRKLE